MNKEFWSWSPDGEKVDTDLRLYSTRDAAVAAAELAFAEECANDFAPSNGDTFGDWVHIYRLVDGPAGFVKAGEPEEEYIEYTHYHGDYDEHSVWHKGGVL